MGQERVKGETATKVEIVLGVLFVLGALSSLGQGHLYSSQAVFSTVGMLFLGAYLLVRGIEWGQLVKAYRNYSTLLAHSRPDRFPRLPLQRERRQKWSKGT